MPAENQHWTSDSDLLDRYVLNQLEPEERARLDAHVRECEECARIVRKEQELVAGIRLFGREELKKRLRERLNKEERQEIPWLKIVGAAATIIFLVSIGLYNRWFVPKEPELMVQSAPQETVKRDQAQPPSEPVQKEQPRVLADETEEGRTKSQPYPADARAELKQKQKATSHGEIRGPVAVPEQLPTARHSASRKQQMSQASEMKETVVVVSPNVAMEALMPTAREEKGELWVEGVALREEKDYAKGLQLLQAPATQREFHARKIQPPGEPRENKRVIALSGESQTVILKQKLSSDMPMSRQLQKPSLSGIPTLIEQTSEGLRMTLYLNQPVSNDVLEETKIEPITQDSVVIHFNNQKILYKIPGGWKQQRGKMEIRK